MLGRKMRTSLGVALLFSCILPFLLLLPRFNALQQQEEEKQPFDVRRHLATVTSYDVATSHNSENLISLSVPDGCTPIHLNLVARHGSRAPTKKRIKELDRLAVRLDTLVADADHGAQVGTWSSQNIPGWFRGWESPWKGRQTGGELIIKGEDELYHLGIRTRERFPDIFNEEYQPHIYSIRATQVPRASASAVAFGIGLFYGKGNLGPGHHRAFSVISESRASDLCLRFFDTCETYKEYRQRQEPAVRKLKEPVLDEIRSEFTRRYKLNFTKEDVASLWFLCKQEASLLNITSQACSLFNPSELLLLEWTEDLEGFLLKGYGKSVNYKMGVPLLLDVLQSIEEAIVAREENHAPGTYEKARLRFAHAETVVPFTCLLGLFLGQTEFEQIQKELPLPLPPKPPLKRSWKGSQVAPFAGNNMLVLYSCPGNASETSPGSLKNKYFVHILHNEVPVPIPGCDGKDFCPFEVFKEKVVNPHLKHDFQSVCTTRLEMLESTTKSSNSCSITCKLAKFLRWLLFLEEPKTYVTDDDEL